MTGKRQLAWFVRHWLEFFERRSSTFLLQRGRNSYQQGNVRNLTIVPGLVTAYVKGLETYQVKFVSKSFSPEEIADVSKMISSQPVLLMRIYQKTLTQDDVIGLPYQLGFAPILIDFSCTCHETIGLCSHLLAAAHACAESFNDDFSQFLKFSGVNWDAVMFAIGGEDVLDRGWLSEGFSMVPVPIGSIRSFESRIGGPPEFWTSSFPFSRMLEEIFHKIREEGLLSHRK
jgi:uncharacterized Zn finger protein